MSNNKILINSILVDDDYSLLPTADKKIFISDVTPDFIESNVKNIFSFETLDKARIICVGQVQSGKTNNIISCIKEAMSLDYDSIIIFGGINKLLQEQTSDRVFNALKSHELFENYDWLYHNEHTKIVSKIQKNKKIIICITKEITALRSIAEQMKSHCIGKDTKFLIIDDESDYGTIDSSDNKDGHNSSIFYRHLEDTYSELKKCKLLYFTATPYSNILLDRKKIELIDEPKIVSLQSSNNYWGLDKTLDQKNYYYPIENIDNETISNGSTISELLFPTLISYIISATEMVWDKPMSSTNKTQCLINISLKRVDHVELKEKIEKIISNLSDCSSYEIKQHILCTIDKFKINCNFSILNEGEQSIFIDEFVKIIQYINNNQSYHCLNGENDSRKDDFINKKFTHEIIIGGLMLSRGVTFENLITQFIVNMPQNIYIDTLLQRCRWLGYRNERAKYMKIILPTRAYEALKDARKYIDIFRPGILDFEGIKEKLVILDSENKLKKIQGTKNDKTKRD